MSSPGYEATMCPAQILTSQPSARHTEKSDFTNDVDGSVDDAVKKYETAEVTRPLLSATHFTDPVNENLKLHRTRSFQQSWYKKYNWLEYNVQKDGAAFCFCSNLL
jgi:hypothetical protein